MVMILEGRALAIGYRDRLVGRDLDVALAEGEVLALLGPNGGGKTTLLKTLLGLLPPRGGDVRCGERSLKSISIGERARLLAYVPQSHVATFAFPAETVVLMGRTAHGNLFSRPTAHDRTVAQSAMQQFGIAHLAEARFEDVVAGDGVVRDLAAAAAADLARRDGRVRVGAGQVAACRVARLQWPGGVGHAGESEEQGDVADDVVAEMGTELGPHERVPPFGR